MQISLFVLLTERNRDGTFDYQCYLRTEIREVKINMACRCIIYTWSLLQNKILRPGVMAHTWSSCTQALKTRGL